MITDYRVWKFSPREWLETAGCTALLTGVIDLVCYRSLWALMLFFPLIFVTGKFLMHKKIRDRQKLLFARFRDLISAMRSSLRSGYSVENAVKDAERELEQSFGKSDPMVKELLFFQSRLSMNIPVERLFTDLGKRSGIEEIRTFASVLTIAKRTGGDMEAVFSNTWDVLCLKLDTAAEIEGMIASKKYEMSIMSLVPFGMILYVQAAFPSFLEILYHNVAGVCIMTFCLLLYLAAIWLELVITDIEV